MFVRTLRSLLAWLGSHGQVVIAAALVVGSISLGATLRGRPAEGVGLFDPALWLPHDVVALGIYLAVLLGAHAAQVLTGRRTDEVLLPAVGLLGGISLLLMERLPQDSVGSGFFGAVGLGQVQLVWLVLGLILYFAYSRTHARLADPARFDALVADEKDVSQTPRD